MATVTALPYEQETEPFRSLFPHCADGIVYLDHAGTGPLPLPVVQAMERHLRRRLHGQTDLSEEAGSCRAYAPAHRSAAQCSVTGDDCAHAQYDDRAGNGCDGLELEAR
jgi:selenocysteine lyase/cysteine desulfurase